MWIAWLKTHCPVLTDWASLATFGSVCALGPCVATCPVGAPPSRRVAVTKFRTHRVSQSVACWQRCHMRSLSPTGPTARCQQPAAAHTHLINKQLLKALYKQTSSVCYVATCASAGGAVMGINDPLLGGNLLQHTGCTTNKRQTQELLAHHGCGHVANR